jgi:cytochrome c peroxidase
LKSIKYFIGSNPVLTCFALTAPYFHDGSAATLMDAIELHNRGDEPNPNLDPLMKPLYLSNSEVRDLAAFLEALSGAGPVIKVPELPANP